jgi:hypothetical protein
MYKILLSIILIASCTSSQKNLRNSLTVDVSLDGDFENTERLYQSVGVSYPVAYGIWASTGIWTDRFYSTGTYWGLGYSFYPLTLF